MASASTILVVVAFVLSMLVAVAIVLGYNRIRRAKGSVSLGEGRASAGARTGERQASAPAELMQAIVRRGMAADPAFSGRTIDFGTAPDGSLEIWLDDTRFSAVDQIPDLRLRELIARAAEEFNRGAPAAP